MRPTLHHFIGTFVALTILLGAVSPQSAQTPARPAPARPDPPRLVVLVVIDQFRGDYPDLYGQQWTHGLARLFNSGAVFPLAAYPYSNTVTCAGHATIGTGSLPRTHGMIGNTWYDPVQRRNVACAADPAAASVAFGGLTGTEHQSARALLSPTLSDELRLQSRRLPRVLSISLKARSAVGLGGHGGPGTIVLWEEDNGTWATSDAFTKTAWPEVDEYVRAHPLAAAYGQTWSRVLPESAYAFDDDGVGENAPGQWKRTFPHVLDSPSGKPDNAFISNWEHSPWSDAYIGDMAVALSARLKLGQDAGGTDMLAISFSALDLVGHEYGPRSHEVQDVLVRLDQVVGKLLDALDRSVGAGRYVLALSADHGVAPIPEQAVALGINAGRVLSTDIRAATQGVLTRLLGEGTFYGAFSETNLSLTPGTLEQLRAKPGAIDAVKTALMAVPGIAHVYGPDELAATTPTDDPILRATRLSYYPGRSGDFVMIPKPYWTIVRTGTTHGTPYGYDQHVPVLFYGAGIKPGRYLSRATPVDIAPTLAALIGVTLSHTDGRVLVDALK
jgi:predicted AlkP superfamily pyrophosphatase or phosphodiesterase